jgi:Fe2+ or Zn2+ uptake regulation protein
MAVADYVLGAHDHPSADRVWREVSSRFPAISRATVYNTLHLFVEKGLLRELDLSTDHVVFDANTAAHHHFIDERTGAIHDVPWESVQVCGVNGLDGYEVADYQVVMRGRAVGS